MLFGKKRAEYFPCLERERNALQGLSVFESPHISKIILYNENTLVMTPLGERIQNLKKSDFKDIINVLKSVHSLNYLHRDLRKYNLICENIVIIDWVWYKAGGES